MSFLVNPYLSSGWAVTVGHSQVDLGKGNLLDAWGFANSDPTYGSFGSIAPATWNGFTIKSLYNTGTTTFFVVVGDATAYSPFMQANGIDQHLGSGSLSGGNTTFQSTSSTPNPFTPVGGVVPVKIT